MTEQHCAQIEELISAQMDSATTPEEDARIERHLGDCADCRATALAFARVDHEVSDYLRATPVPAIGTPWREQRHAPIALPGLVARWRPATIALTTILVLVVAAVLAFGAFRGNTQSAVQTSAPQSDYGTGSGAAPSTAASAAPRAAASAAPTAAASAAPAAAPAMAPASGARATAASAGAAPPVVGAAGSFGTPAASAAASSAPSGAAAAGSQAVFNPVQALHLDTATSVSVCQPDCTASPQGADTFKRIVAILNAALPIANAPAPQSDPKTVLLRFTLADGTQVELQYLPALPGGDLTAGRLKLPDGRFTIAPTALGEALAAPKSMP